MRTVHWPLGRSHGPRRCSGSSAQSLIIPPPASRIILRQQIRPAREARPCPVILRPPYRQAGHKGHAKSPMAAFLETYCQLGRILFIVIGHKGDYSGQGRPRPWIWPGASKRLIGSANMPPPWNGEKKMFILVHGIWRVDFLDAKILYRKCTSRHLPDVTLAKWLRG